MPFTVDLRRRVEDGKRRRERAGSPARSASPPPTLYHPESPLEVPLTIMSWNVNMDRRVDRLPPSSPLAWVNRSAYVCDAIRHERCDVIVLFEMRVRPLLCQLAPLLGDEYDLVYSKRAAGELEFVNALFYRRSKLFLTEHKTVWMSNETPHLPCSTLAHDHPYGRCMLVATLLPVVEGVVHLGARPPIAMRQTVVTPPLTVVGVHFGLDERAKTAQSAFLRDWVQANVPEGAPCVLCGDFNSFNDGDWAAQRGMLEETGCADTRVHTRYRLSQGAWESWPRARRTFVPYSVEDDLRRLCTLEDSFLDGVFVRALRVLRTEVLPLIMDSARARCVLMASDPNPAERVHVLVDRTPSDHWPIVSTTVWQADPVGV